MNNWLVVALIAGVTCFLSIVFVLCFLYSKYRERTLLTWAGAWTAHSVRNLVILVSVLNGRSPMLTLIEQYLVAVTAFLLLLGAAQICGRPLGRAVPAAMAALAAWIPVAVFAPIPPPWFHIPTYFVFGGAQIACGVVLLRHGPGDGLGRRIAGWALILWGLHHLDFPFLRSVAWFAPWGFLIGAVLGLITAISVILAYFELIQARLKDSETRFRALFLGHDAIFLLIEPESGAIIDANRSALDFYGYGREELLAMRVSEINTLPAEHLRALRLKTLDGSARQFVFPHRLKNGETRTVEVYSSPVQIAGRTLLFSIIHDTTDRLKAQEALRENRERYRAVVEAADSGIVLLDGTGRILSMNGFARGILGRAGNVGDGDVLRLSAFCLREDGTELPPGQDPAALTLTTGQPGRDALLGAPLDGDVVWISVNTAPVLTADGKNLGGVAVTFTDVTKSRRAELMLEELNRTMTTVLESVPAGVNVVRVADKEILFMNKAAMTTFGGDHEGGRCYVSFRAKPARCENCSMAELFDSANRPRSEIVREEFNPAIGRWLLHHERAVRWIDGSMARVQISVDITERRANEERLAASLKEKEVLLREIHHRVKNNLQVVSSLLYLQQQECTDPESRHALEESRNRIASMAQIHEQLYRSNKLDRIDVGQFLEELLPRLATSLAGGRAIALELRPAPVTLTIERAIPFGLVANELATNAFKHAFPDGAAGTVTVELTSDGAQATLTVSDDGKGLPEGFSLESPQTLGMQLVSSLASQLRGTVRAENSGGAVFTLRIPLDS